MEQDKPLMRIKCQDSNCCFQWETNEPDTIQNNHCQKCGKMNLSVEPVNK